MKEIARPVEKNRKKDSVLKDFARQLSDEDIRFACFHLAERKSGDLGEAVEYLQQHPDVDRVFAAARDADGLYDAIDEVQEYLEREWSRRSYPS